METVGFLALAATVIKIVSVVKAIGKDTNYVATQAATWAVGVAVLFLAGAASVTANLELPGFEGTPLGSMDAASVVLAGLVLGSTAAFSYDVRKSLDNSDSAVEASLLRDAPGE